MPIPLLLVPWLLAAGFVITQQPPQLLSRANACRFSLMRVRSAWALSTGVLSLIPPKFLTKGRARLFINSLIITMKKYAIVFSLLLGIAFLGVVPSTFAFTLSGATVDVGSPVLITGAVASNLYSIFWINASNPNNEACAYIYGQDLTGYFATDSDGIDQFIPGDNDLSHYGSCFVNDSGTFKIVELSDWGFAANFPDSLQSSEFFVSFKTLVVN